MLALGFTLEALVVHRFRKMYEERITKGRKDLGDQKTRDGG